MKVVLQLVVFSLISALSFIAARGQNSSTLQREQLPPVMLPEKTPPTVRTIAPFNRIKQGMTMKQVVAACGLPDDDIGSGIHIYVYKLSDGSQVRVGTPDAEQIMYVAHELANGGGRRQILRSHPTNKKFRAAIKCRPTTRSSRRPTR